MIEITQLNINQPLSPLETHCDTLISQWMGKDVSKGNRTKNDLVTGIHESSDKAIVEIQASSKQLEALQESEMPPYPYKQLFRYTGYCAMSSLILLLALGCFGGALTVIIVRDIGLSTGAKLGIILTGIGATAILGVLFATVACSKTSEEYFEFNWAVSQYEADVEAYRSTYEQPLIALGSIVYRKDDQALKGTLGQVGKRIALKFQEVIATIQRLKKDRLAFANQIANYLVTLNENAQLSLQQACVAIQSAEQLEELHRVISTSANGLPSELIRLILSYVGMQQEKPAENRA